jgi:hypothetical protein
LLAAVGEDFDDPAVGLQSDPQHAVRVYVIPANRPRALKATTH